MSYISILLPAFAFPNSLDNIEEIKKFCSEQFECLPESYEIFPIKELEDEKDKLKKIKRNHYAIKFKDSNLSLSTIENLIYQRDCVKSICDKTFESLQATMEKLNNLQREIKSFNENGKSNEEMRKELVNDNIRLRDLLESQIEYSDNFRINTEKTLNKIKDEFQTMVLELESMRKKTNKSKPVTQREPGSSYTNTTKKKPSSAYSNSNSNIAGTNSTHGGIHTGVPKLNFK